MKMPGLVGIVKKNGDALAIEKLLRKMCQIIKYEDWYKTDTFLDKIIGMGRISLGILNPEPQPIFSENKNLCIMMEGEIYDYENIKDELISHGHKFSINNDPEFILHLYEEYGKSFVSKLNGSFILIIWDKEKQELLIINDRYGLRPLYYTEQNGYLLFGTEIKAILQDASFKRIIDDKAVSDFFTFGYILNDKTFFQGIKKLSPASIMTYNLNNIIIDEYWSFDFWDEHEIRSEDYNLKQFQRYLLKAVDRQMKGDYKIGVQLSGGLDSRVISASIDKQYYPIHSFTFGKLNSDDVKFANMLANKLGTYHHFFEYKSSDFTSGAEKAVYLTEGMLNVLHIHRIQTCVEMKKYVDIVLNGAEALHIWYEISQMESIEKKHSINNEDNDLFQYMYTPLDESNSKEFAEKLFSEEYYSKIKNHPADSLIEMKMKVPINCSPFKKIEYYNLKRRQFNFTFNGIIFLRSQIEVRTPLFDNDLMDFIFTLPPKYRAEDKILYTKTIHNIFPDLVSIPWQKTGLPIEASEISKRMYKLGQTRKLITNRFLQIINLSSLFEDNKSFVDPGEWMRNDIELKKYITNILLSQRSLERGYFNPICIRKLIDEHISGNKNYSHLIGLLLTFELFNRMFIDKNEGPSAK